MWELMICVAVSWGGACEMQRPVTYSTRYFCEQAIPAAKASRPKVTAIYCRPKS